MKGSEKQIKWAEDIKQEMLNALDKNYESVEKFLDSQIQNYEESIQEAQDEGFDSYVENFRNILNEIQTAKHIHSKLERLISSCQDATWFIDHQGLTADLSNGNSFLSQVIKHIRWNNKNTESWYERLQKG